MKTLLVAAMLAVGAVDAAQAGSTARVSLGELAGRGQPGVTFDNGRASETPLWSHGTYGLKDSMADLEKAAEELKDIDVPKPGSSAGSSVYQPNGRAEDGTFAALIPSIFIAGALGGPWAASAAVLGLCVLAVLW